MALDFSRDYLIEDNPLTVTLAAKAAGETWGSPATVAYCQQDAITKEDAAANPALVEADSAAWTLWAVPLAGAVPKIGDKITSAGVTWFIKSVGHLDRDASGAPQRFRCLCLRSKAAN